MYSITHISGRSNTLLTTFRFNRKGEDTGSTFTYIDILTDNGEREAHVAKINHVIECLATHPVLTLLGGVRKGSGSANCKVGVPDKSFVINGWFIRGQDERVRPPEFETFFEEVWMGPEFKAFIAEYGDPTQ